MKAQNQHILSLFSVEATPINRFPLPQTSITGGILGNNTYKLVVTDYFWSNSTTAPVSGSIDGVK